MKGFKPTGFGPSAGFKYPQNMGFTGSTGAYTNVSPYVRRKFANGGYVRKEIGDQGSAMIRRARSSNALDQASGGKSAVRPGYKKGGCMKKADGGYVNRSYRKPRRYTEYTLSEGVRAIPPLAKEMASSVVGKIKRSMGPRQRTYGPTHKTEEEVMASNYRRGGKAKRMGYAKGGAAHSDIAEDRPLMTKIAQKVVGEHVRYPAPKGHKGLEKAMRR